MIPLADGNFDRTLEVLTNVCRVQTLGQAACLENSLQFRVE